MDFINRNFSGTIKMILVAIIVLIFIRILPLLFVVGFIGWAGSKSIKYFKNKKNKKTTKSENVNINFSAYDKKDDFDFTGKNIIDVEYEEIKK